MLMVPMMMYNDIELPECRECRKVIVEHGDVDLMCRDCLYEEQFEDTEIGTIGAIIISMFIMIIIVFIVWACYGIVFNF